MVYINPNELPFSKRKAAEDQDAAPGSKKQKTISGRAKQLKPKSDLTPKPAPSKPKDIHVPVDNRFTGGLYRYNSLTCCASAR